MSNTSGNAYGLTALIPILSGSSDDTSYDKQVRDQLQRWPKHDNSPMAKIPNTYLCRFYLLNDVFFQGHPATEEHLKSQYLVYEANFYGDLDDYLSGAWECAQQDWKKLLHHCVAFNEVTSKLDFINYIKRCQINNDLYFNGSNDQSLSRQLKSLFLKQSLSHFAFLTQEFQAQGELGERRLQYAFQEYTHYASPDNIAAPTWPVGATAEPPTLYNDLVAIVERTKETVQ